MFQVSTAYSRIVRSDEKLPIPATLRMALRVQASGVRKSSSMRIWVAR